MGRHRIILAADTATVRLEVGRGALCVRHKTYSAPQTLGGCAHCTFDEFETDFRAMTSAMDTLVIVGMNRIINPGNRTHEVFEFLHNDSARFTKTSVDRTLWIGEPWRAWFHFGFVGAKYREYTYSYLAESHYKAHIEGVRENDPFNAETIAECGDGLIVSDHEKYFTDVRIETIAMSDAVHSEYQREKESAFNDEKTLKGIVNRLARIASDACPFRSIPTPTKLFDHREHRIVRTDLGVDKFLTDGLLRSVELTNATAARFHHGG